MGRRRKDDPKDWDIDGCRLLCEHLFRAMSNEYIWWMQAEQRTRNKIYKEKCRAEMRACEEFYLTSPLVGLSGAEPIGILDTLRRRADYPISYTEELRRKNNDDRRGTC